MKVSKLCKRQCNVKWDKDKGEKKKINENGKIK